MFVGGDEMDYKNYKESRDIAWELLIKYNVKSFPVKISEICRGEGIRIRSFGQSRELLRVLGFEKSTQENDGFAVILEGKGYIFYNDACSPQRQRFTVAHELGHFVSGDVGEIPTLRNKEPEEGDNDIEHKANVIAARLLATACVLWGLGVHSAREISELCDISTQAAEWRMRRMETLYKREEEFLKTKGKSCFLLSPSERRVYEQFREYIDEIKNQGRF